MQRSTPAESACERSIEIYLERLKGDVWTVEATENDLAEIDLFKPYAGRLQKKVAVGVVNHHRPCSRHTASRRRAGTACAGGDRPTS